MAPGDLPRSKPSTDPALLAWLQWRFGDNREAPLEPHELEAIVDEATQRAIEHSNQDSEHA